jgi:phospholipid-translocating ATPase
MMVNDTSVTEILQVIVEKDQRVPADLVLLRTTERSGACFVRTDQLDGETDWKLRLSVPAAQKLDSDLQLFDIRASLFVEKPQRDIHSFIGTFTRVCNVLRQV